MLPLLFIRYVELTSSNAILYNYLSDKGANVRFNSPVYF